MYHKLRISKEIRPAAATAAAAQGARNYGIMNPSIMIATVAEREGSLNRLGRGCACYGEKQRMLYSTEKSANSTTEFVKMVVESQ